jgi:branched-chain amino acid transport system permease protein
MIAASPLQEAGWLRRRGWELVVWIAVPACVALLFPDYFVLASQISAAALFVLSLDLLVGYAGLLSLGHAVFFGLGAYTAGLISKGGWSEPVSALLAAGLVAGLLGYATGFVVVRVRHLAQLMVTLGIGLLVFEGASRMRGVTGGDDGLQGMTISPLFGVFPFDMYGHTAFAYAFGVLAICFVIMTRIIDSPFGLTLQGLRDNPHRMAAIGTPGSARLRKAYTIAAVFAGIAGGLLAQTTQFVALETLSFHLSAEVLIMLVLGGAGYRYGGLVGAAVYMIARDLLSDLNPEFWQLGVGAVMVLVVLFAPDGVLGGVNGLIKRFGRARQEQS